MALNHERLQSADLVLTCPQPTLRSAQEHTVRSFRPSALTAGSVGVNATFTDANITVACVGLLVAPDDGAARGLFARIMSVSGTTATLDRPWPSVTNVTSVSAWKDPTIPVRVTTADASGAIDVISTEHAGLTGEPDGYWATGEYLLVGVAGANAGRAALITGFTSSTGTFVVTTGILTSTTIGDLFEIWQLVKLEADVDASVDQKVLQRSFMGTGRIAADVPVPITVDGHVSLEMGAKMITTAGASGVAASRPMNISGMLESCFTRHSDTGGTVVSASASIINSGSSALTQGGFVLLNTGEVVQVLATDDGGAVGVIDVAAYTTGALNHAAVTAGSVMNASTWYEPKTTDFRNQAFALYRGGYHMQRLFGCLPGVTLTIDRDMIVKWKLAFTAGESISYPLVRPVALGATAPLMLPDNTIPTDPKWSRCLLDGVQMNVSNIAIDFGFSPQIRKSLRGMNESDGAWMQKRPNVTVSFQILADDDETTGNVAMIDRIPRRTNVQFLFQKGRAPKETFAVGVPAMFINKAEFAYDGGLGVYNCEADCVDPVAAGYAAATYANLPPISVGWL